MFIQINIYHPSHLKVETCRGRAADAVAGLALVEAGVEALHRGDAQRRSPRSRLPILRRNVQSSFDSLQPVWFIHGAVNILIFSNSDKHAD